MNKQNYLKTGIKLRAERDGRMSDVDLLDATDHEVDTWFESRRRYGESIVGEAIKALLHLIREMGKEIEQINVAQQESKKVKK